MTWIGLAVVLAIWVAIIWVLTRILGFNRLDEDPEDRDPYN